MALNFQGRVWRDGRFWLIEVCALDVMTQGRTRKEALEMLKDAVESLVDRSGFEVDVTLRTKNAVILGTRGGQNDKLLAAFFLKQQRAKNGLSLNQVVGRLKITKNAYAQYEQGRSLPSLAKIQEFVAAMNDNAVFAVDVLGAKKRHPKGIKS